VSAVAVVLHPGRGLEQLQADFARPLRCQVRPVVRIERHDDAMFAVRADADIGPALARNAFYGGPPRTIVFDGFVVTEVVGRAPVRTRDDDAHAIAALVRRFPTVVSADASPCTMPITIVSPFIEVCGLGLVGVFTSDWGRALTLRPDLRQVVEVGPVFFQVHDGHACRGEDYQPRSRRGALGIQTVTSQ